ncbi:MAG: S8 family serine peptidase [Clostridia bacterium]|nr:S8 family serine peptidase [Clostridia bacterium]
MKNNHVTFGKKLIALLLAVVLCAGYLTSAAGQSYALSHPASVNQGKTDAEVEADDLEQFSERSGYDYHDAKEEDYAPHELILEVTSTPSAASASISSLEDEFDLECERVLTTTELEEESVAKIASLDEGNSIITTYFMSTKEDDIIALCDSLNAREEVFNAQPNFRYEICEAAPAADLSDSSEQSTPAAPNEAAAEEPGKQTTEPAAEDTTAPVTEASQTPAEEGAPSLAKAYTEPPAFGTTGYTNYLKWWFDYCEISSAWSTYADSSTGYGMGKGVKVAVIDTGCNTAHEDIVDNLWVGPEGQCGYYAYTSTNISINDSTMDTNGHGSHCCGTIAMSGDNTVGGIGTAPKCSLMVMKADRNNGKDTFYDSELITSLNKAKEYGADIISMSLGGYDFSYATFRTYQAVSSSCLIVCAAGNESLDTTQKLCFPAAASCVMGVMALSTSGNRTKLADFSNYDTSGNFYKVVAPGDNIYSLDYSGNNKYCTKRGTSMATPATAGMIASFMSYIKYVKGWDWTPAQYQYEVEYLMNYSGNSLSCTAYSQSKHPVAYNLGSSFKVMNLKYLFSRMSNLNTSPFANTSAVSFNNSTIRDGVVNATGLSASELDNYAMRRVSLLYWSSESTRKAIEDYSDLSKLTGLNYLDLSGSSKITSANIDSVISKCPATLLYLNLNTNAKLGNLSCLASANFSNLYYLNTNSNNMTSISSLQKFTSLKYLYANSNAIVDISPLSGMKHIEHLELNNNQIQDPNPAFASDMLSYIDLSHNKLVDHTQLLNYKGAYHDSDFNSSTITFKVDYNNMTGLTTAYANTIISAITANNTKGGVLIATTINFTYSNQTAPASTTPMTSFKIENKTVTREELCSGNLNLNSITGFTAYPSGANQYNYLNWTCSEEGYFSSDGTILAAPEEITSCRTLTLTGTAPEASGATSTVTGTPSQTIKLTITAPEVYNAYLTDRVLQTGNQSGIIVTTNQYATKVFLKFTKSGSSDIVVRGSMPDTSIASGGSKTTLFSIPSSVTGTAGNYSCYVYPSTDAEVYGTTANDDVTGKSTYPYKYLGYLYVKDSVETATDTINVTYDSNVNRYGQSAIYAVNSGTTSSSPAKPTGSYGLSTYTSQRKYIGAGSYYGSYGAGYFGKDYTGYPTAQTGEASFFIDNSDHSEIDVESKINTVAPEVKAVEMRNSATYKTDGYVEYLVKTNTDATEVKAYSIGTTDDISSDVNHLITTFNSSQGTYANYNATYSHKLWSIKVPLTSNKTIQPVNIVAADPLGDGTATKTPATGLQFSGTQYIYANEDPYKTFGDALTILPADEQGNSLADCCKNVTYSVSNSDYFSVYTNYNGKIKVDMQKVLTDLENTTAQYKYTNVTATLENGATANALLYAHRPIAKGLAYDTEASSLTYGGTVYYTVKTYGSDTIYVRAASDKYSEPLMTYTLADTDHYTTGTDEFGNAYILWNFTRTFDTGVTTLRTYVRSSLDYSDEQTFNSATYTSLTVNRTLEPADYSQWEAATARLDESALTALSASYGAQSELYAQRLAACNDYIAGAVLTYDETQQDRADAQTEQLNALIDTLFAYGDYDDSIAAFNALDNSENAKYITPALRSLVATEITDANRKSVSAAIDEALATIEALVQKTQQVESYIATLETEVPELRGSSVPQRFSADTYNTLKAQYDTLKANLAALTYPTAAALDIDFASLQEARDALHEHNYIPTVTAPTCTEQGYTTYRCDGCEDQYITAFTPALGHQWSEWTVTTPATFLENGIETRTCSRCHAEETREIAATGQLEHTKIGDATDFTVNVSIADASTGKYQGLIDVALIISTDYRQLDTDDEKTLKTYNQIITIDPTVVSTVSRASKTRGTPNMQEMIDAATTDPLKYIKASKDWAISSVPLPTYDDCDEEDMLSFLISSTSTLAYNEELGKVLIQFSGYSDEGYLYTDDVDVLENTVIHLYLALQDGKTLQDARNAIALATDADIASSGTPRVMKASSFVSSNAEDPGAVHQVVQRFSYDFYPKYDITFHWFGDEGVENTTVESVTEGFVPEGITPPDYRKGDYEYHFSSWDKTLAPASEDTDYIAQYTSTFLGHNYVAEITKQPTCTAQGETTYTCSRCGESYTEPIAALGHTPKAAVEENRVEPTCQTAGSYDAVVYCSVCEAELSRTPQTLDALGHIWGDWTETTAPTCEGQGVETRICQRDNAHTETRPVAALGHNYEPTVTAPTCTERGYTTYNCTRCEASYIADYVDALGHTPKAAVEENRVEPTCQTAGSYDAVVYCSVCKAELSRTPQTLDALGHIWGDWTETTAPTCEEQGVETRNCQRDNAHTETRPVAALGHNYEPTVTAPTCTERGYTTYNCTRCEASYIDDYVDALGHTPKAAVEENRVEPTCQTAGSYDLVVYCSVCKAELSRTPQTIDALGHDWGEWQRTKQPTCTEKGEDTAICTRDAAHKQTREVDMIEHDYKLHDEAPLDKHNGYVYFTCEQCKGIFTATFDGSKYVADQQSESASAAQSAAPLPAPYFNIFVTDDYAYSTRGASLRLSESAAYDKDFDTTQGMRFTASMKVPEGVGFEIGKAGNYISDIGFVYSQDSRIDHDINNLVMGAPDVYSMSVASKNEGSFDGSNWQGVTYHQGDNTLTYNLVINVKAQNWEKAYCARAYVTYNFNGYTFTVYDSEYAYRDVVTIARAIVASQSESQQAKEFCQNKILKNI